MVEKLGCPKCKSSKYFALWDDGYLRCRTKTCEWKIYIKKGNLRKLQLDKELLEDNKALEEEIIKILKSKEQFLKYYDNEKKLKKLRGQLDEAQNQIRGDDVMQIQLDGVLDEIERLKGWLVGSGMFELDISGIVQPLRKK